MARVLSVYFSHLRTFQWFEILKIAAIIMLSFPLRI